MSSRSLSRRGLIVGGGAAAALTAGAGLSAWSAQSHAARPSAERQVEPFYGDHQAGIATAPQAHAMFLALDLLSAADADMGTARENLRSILRLWTTDAARLTQGIPALADTEPELATTTARLTVSAGLGPSVFAKTGLADRCPASARDFPAFSTDRLDKRWCGGDLCSRYAPIVHCWWHMPPGCSLRTCARWPPSDGARLDSAHRAPKTPPGARCAISWGRSTAP